MSREKHVTPITVAEKQKIINDSVQALLNKPVMSGEDLKKRFVSPIVNVDGRANIGDVVDRIARETEAALDEIDGIAGSAAETAQNTQDDLTAHKQAYETHLSEYETYKTAQEQKDKSQSEAISELIQNKQDNLVIDGGYSQNNPVTTVNTVNGKLRPIEQAIPQLGATLSMSIDPLTYVLTVQLKNKSGEVVSTVNSDLPLEEMVVNAHFEDDEKKIVLELKNGNSVRFSVADLVEGLISQKAFEDALALQKTDYEEKISKKADKLNGKNVLMGTDGNGNQTEYPVSSVGTRVNVGGEKVEEFNADTKVDVATYNEDKGTTEEAINKRVKTDIVGVAGGVASLNEEGKVPKSQLPASVGGLGIGETYDTAFAGDRGLKLERQVKTLYSFHEEAGDIIVAPIDTAFNERTTADGANVVTNSIAVIKKVEGNTVVVGKDENGLNGTLVNANFKGIESKNADGTVISTLEFPEKIPTPFGVTIDFENKKILDYGVTVILTGEELYYTYSAVKNDGMIGVYSGQLLPTTERRADAVCTDATIDKLGSFTGDFAIGIGNDRIYWARILTKLGIVEQGKEDLTDTEKTNAITAFKEWLAERYASGNPVTIRYISSELQSETPFTEAQLLVGDNYVVVPQGTETVLGNDTEAENKPTIEYVIKAGA